jgi:hypothetical protein
MSQSWARIDCLEADHYLLEDGSGLGHFWWIKSIRIADGDEGLSLYAEVVNPSHEFLASTSLDVVLSTDGASHGRQRLGAAVEVVPPGGSALYQTTTPYGGSQSVGDWDDCGTTSIWTAWQQSS